MADSPRSCSATCSSTSPTPVPCFVAAAPGWETTERCTPRCRTRARSIARPPSSWVSSARSTKLNDTDRHHGHRRVYDPESLRADVHAAGLRIRVFGGFWLKPVSNAQIEETWSDAMLDSFFALGERHPDIAAEIYVVADAG